MTIDLTNPAVAFLFFGTISVWTFFVIWAFGDEKNKKSQASLVGIGMSLLLTALIALIVVITNALTQPQP